MPNTNDFQPFATGGGANVVTQAQFTALTSILANGFASGTAVSAQLNKVWRQSSFVSSAVAQLISDALQINVLDNGVVLTFEEQLRQAISLCNYGIDTGAANAYAVTYNVPVNSVIDGEQMSFRAANTNTGASTFNPSGLGTAPILNMQLTALTGGEITAGADYTVIYNSPLTSWILESTTTTRYQAADTPTGLINGSNVIYTLPHVPKGSVPLFINRQYAIPGTDFSISGATITILGTALGVAGATDTINFGEYRY
jgi:hypothetical protein